MKLLDSRRMQRETVSLDQAKAILGLDNSRS
jgi:hypothetical protein